MKITIQEYGRIDKRQIGERAVHRLRKLDALYERRDGMAVFDWRYDRYIRARSVVGVIELPGLTIEVLPKTDKGPSSSNSAEWQNLARQNLLYMLAFTRDLPVKDRDVAHLATQRMTILEILAYTFAKRLVEIQRTGLAGGYVRREENCFFVKGKILTARNLLHNPAREDRIFVSFSEFSPDNKLNQLLKYACRILLRATYTSATLQMLREAVQRFADISDVRFTKDNSPEISLDRTQAQYQVLINFARMIIHGLSSSPSADRNETFSILFPMEQLFEEFIARFILKNSHQIGLSHAAIFVQSRGHQRSLVTKNGKAQFRLKPDLFIDAHAGPDRQIPRTILDTKWKILDGSAPKQGVSQADMYQLYAYSQRFDCPVNILLYPAANGVKSESYAVESRFGVSPKRINVETINLNRSLIHSTEQVIQDLRKILLTAQAE
ncbi:MAG: McrC family protein [Deltaproteobacteria bacterium]|nr:McrC family protein [Deltaproteobacteria bacterium]